MAHALLLSPDDQAVSAITGVLEEMSVSCERPLDGVSAAQKLNAQSFDLVLVDCENLPAAKLIFDVCRRGKDGNHPVPIAIVDGRAGLPTAFRLGAELILTKPVSKDQARTTIRTAVSRIKKDAPVAESAGAGSDSERTADASGRTVQSAIGAMSAAGSAVKNTSPIAVAEVSEQLTSFAEPAPSFAAAAGASTSSSGTSTIAALAAGLAAKRAAQGFTPNVKIPDNSVSAKVATPRSSLSSGSAPIAVPDQPVPPRPAATTSKPTLVIKPSDDPVLAELDRTESEEKERELKDVAAQKAASARPAEPQSRTEVAATPAIAQPKRNGMLAATLMLALAGGGLYAAWMYRPDLRAFAQPQIDRLMTLVGMALPPTQPPKPAKTSGTLASAKPAPQPAVNSSQASPTVQPPAVADLSADASAPSPLTDPSATGNSASAAVPAESPAVVGASPTFDAKKADLKQNNSAKAEANEPVEAASTNAVILSSQGAQKRLLRSVTPKYPVEAQSRAPQGTIVLKTFVDSAGRVGSVRLVEGNATLAPTAIEAVKQWRYRPYVRDGKAYPFQTVVILDFQRP
jgi:protein TonB